MELFILDNGEMEKDGEKGNKFGLMDQFMKDFGKITKLAVLVV